ncbi:MAG: 6-carboxytetrahydropterin synthase QueD [Candidatus Wallbacteria bacterium]|nr:6-carboxytetrahydropterin synthase QueD [Candidatus Wallbacteria bacterium]MBI4865371.1 6-carboxytetrahydropterin synthase QueD [Candidatus Wallbacteria bacterium]
MYEIQIEDTFAGAHRLVGYVGKCQNLHGHNWRVQVGLEAESLDSTGLLMDFTELKRITRSVLEELDHTYLNELPAFREVNPSAENLSKYIFDRVSERLPGQGATLTHVRVHETDRYSATYRPSRAR